MSISDNQKLDFLWKKLGYGATKTDTNAIKNATNEANPSPLLLSGSDLWTDAYQIPSLIPTASNSIITVYDDTGNGSSTVETTEDTTASPNRTWNTGVNNWIPPQFGSTYQVKVYIAPTGTANPQTTGTQVFAAGSGNNDEWFFDYQSGILNFIGTNLPSGIDGNEIFISGARYVGKTGNRFTALYADSADIGHAFIDSADIDMADIVTAYIDSADILHAIIDSADITLGRINTAIIDSADIGHAFIDSAEIGILNITGQINGPETFIIDPAAVGDNTGRVIIKGDLQVDGTETIVNSTTVTVNDKNIVLADSAQDSSQADGAGITVFAADAKITYEASPDRWVFNKDIDVPAIYADSGIITNLTSVDANITRATIDSAGITTATITGLTADSAHVKGNLTVGGDLTVSGNATIKSDVGGNIYLGDSNEDNIVFSGDINSHLIPNTTETFDLGSLDKRWRDLFLSGQSIYIGGVILKESSGKFVVYDSSGQLTDVLAKNITAQTLNISDSAFINLLKIDSGDFEHFYADSANIGGLHIDSATVRNLNITGELTGVGLSGFIPNTVAIVDQTGTLTSDSGISYDITKNDLTVENTVTAKDIKITSLYPGYILTSGASDSIGFTEGLKYGSHTSGIISNDGFATSFQKLYDSGYYRFNIDDNTGKLINTGDVQLGRFTDAEFGTYYNPQSWTLPSNISEPRDFYGLEIFTDSAKLVSTAHTNIFKSSLNKDGSNADSFNIIEVLSREDSTLFEIRKDGSVNFTGHIYKNGSVFTGGGIFIKDEPTGDAAYSITTSDITDPIATSLGSFGRVAIGTNTPKYKLDVVGDISVRGQIDSAGAVYALNTLSGATASYMDDSNGSRFTYITPMGATRGGYFRGGANGDYFQGNIGLFSTAFGEATRAKGIASFAAGSLTEAEGNYSIAIGKNSKTRGNNHGAILIGTDVLVDSSVTVGATQYAVGIGKELDLSGLNAIAIGTENTVHGNQAGTFGYNNVIGSSSSRTATAGSYAFGINNNIISGGASFALGNQNILKANAAIAVGDTNFIDANNGFALGTDISVHGVNATGIGRDIRIDSDADNTVAINLSITPVTVSSERIMAIQGGNVIIGDSSDKFSNYDGNLYVKGNVVVAGEILNEGEPGVFQSTTPFVDAGTAVSYNVLDGNGTPKPLGINTPNGPSYSLDVIAQEGFVVSGTTDGTFTVADSAMIDSSPFIGGTDQNFLIYSPKLEAFRVGKFTDYEQQLTNSKIGLGSIALGKDNSVAGLYSTAIGNNNTIGRGIDSGSFSSLKGSYNTFLGHNNSLDSIATGSNNFVLGEDNFIKGTTTDTVLIGRNITATDLIRKIIMKTADAGDSAFDNTKVAIGKDDAEYALDVRGTIRVDSGATMYFGSKTIQDYLGFGSTTEVGAGFGTGAAIANGIDSIQFDHTIDAINNVARVKVPYDHQLYIAPTMAPDLTKAIQLDNIPLSELTTKSGNDLDTVFYFADPIDSFQFALRRDSHGGPPVVSTGAIDSDISIVDGFDFGDSGDILIVPYTAPKVLNPDLNVDGNLFVGGDGSNLRVDSNGLTFNSNLVFTAGGTSFRFDSAGAELNGSVTIGGLSFDSHVVRPGNMLGDFIDTDYVQARVSNNAFWRTDNTGDALIYKPSGSVKPLLGGLTVGDFGTYASTATADHTFGLAVRNVGKSPIIINDTNDYIDDASGNSPITVRSGTGALRQWPTQDYLATVVDQDYISARITIDSVALQNFIDQDYVRSFVDSNYILSAANDSSEWQRTGDTLFFGTYPNVQNVKVGIGTETPQTKFHVAGVGRFDSGLTVTGGPVNISGTQITVDSDYFFQINDTLLADDLNTLNQGALIAALNANTDSTFEAFYFPTPPEQRFVDVWRIDSAGDSQQLTSGTDYFFANPNSFQVHEASVDSDDLSLNVNLRTIPATISFTGADLNGDTLDINTTYAGFALLDSQQNSKAGYGGTFTPVSSSQVTFTDHSSIALGDIFRVDDKSPKVTTSLSLTGPTSLTGNLTVNNGYTTTLDALTTNTLTAGTTSFTGPVTIEASASTFSIDSNVTMYYGPGGLSFDSNIERVVDSGYIGNRLQGIWSFNNDAYGNQQIYYDDGGAVVIGEPGDMVAGDSDTKLFVKSGNVIFRHGDWDSADVAITTAGVIPDFSTNVRYGDNAGARLMWIPQRGAFRVGAVDGSTVSWDDDEVGRASVGIGYNTLATDYSIALGYDVKAGHPVLNKINTVSIGHTVDNQSANGVAVGSNITHSQLYAGSVSIGEGIVNNKRASSVAIGKDISDNIGVSIGKTVSTTVTNSSVSIGLDQRASTNGVSIGKSSPSNNSTSIGKSSTSSLGATVIGASSTASSGSVSIGSNVSASTNGTVIGKSNSASTSGVAIGKSSSSGFNSISIGTSNSSSYANVAIGKSNSVTSNRGDNVAIGTKNDVGANSVAIGYNNTGSAYYGGMTVIGSNNSDTSHNVFIAGRDNNNTNGRFNKVTVVGRNNNDNTTGRTVFTSGQTIIFGHENDANVGSAVFGSKNDNNQQVNIYGSNNIGSADGNGGYIFGSNNTITRDGMLFGYGNSSTDNGYAFGVGNTTGDGGYAYGGGNSVTLGIGYAFGYGNTVDGTSGSEDPMAFGHSNTASSGGIAFGENLTVSNGGIAVGANSIASGFRSLAIGSGITVSGQNSVGIGLSSSTTGTVVENNTLSIMGGKVAIGQAAADAAYDVDIYGNVHVGVFGDYWRHGKRLSQYITDDVANDAYVKGIANSAYVQGIINIPYLRSTMTSQYFFYSDAISNDLYTTTSGSVGIGRQPVNSSKYKLDVDGSINYTGKLYLNGDLLVPSEDSLGDVYFAHYENQYYIDADSAEEYFDSAYVTARQQMFGFTAGQTYTSVIDEGYINSRLDDTLFIDSGEAQVLIDASLASEVAFGFDYIGRSSLEATPGGGVPSVGIGVIADIPGTGNMLKVAGATEIQGNLNIANSGVLSFNGVPFTPTTVFTEDFSYIYYNGTKNIGVGTTTPAVDFEVDGTFNATEIQLNGADILQVFDSDYVRDRQFLIDSALTTQLIDSSYIKGHADSDYVRSAITTDFMKSFIDSAYIKGIADSDYIKLLADSDYIKFVADSDYIKLVADSDYIKLVADQAWIRTNADSDYIKTHANQAWIRSNADSDYIKTHANQAWIRSNADSAYILSAANPAYVLSVADSDYVKTVVDSAYTQLLTGIGIRDVDFGANKIEYRNTYSNLASLPTATSHKGMFAVVNSTNKPYVSTGAAWEKLVLSGDSVEFNDLIVTGDLTVLGTRTVLNTQTLGIDDPMIHLGKNNEVSDAVDIGFIGHYSPDGGTTKEHTGIFRDASNSEYYIFNGLADTALDDSDPTATVNRSGTGFTLAALNVGSISGQYLGFDSDFGVKTTTDLTEGSNLYYTTTRANTDFDTRLATKTTGNLTEGSNLYYTTARVNADFDTRLATKTTTDLIEGTNLYYTDDRVTTHVDSAYVQARVVPQGVDSNAVASLIDSDYILQITGTGITTAEVTTGSLTTFDQTPHNSDFRSVEYLIHMDDSDNGQSQISKILLTYNKSNVFTTEYGLVNSYSNDSNMGEITAVANASMIQLQLTKSTGTGTVAVKTTKTIIS